MLGRKNVAVHKAFMVLQNIKMVGAKKVYSEGGFRLRSGKLWRNESSDVGLSMCFIRRRFFLSSGLFFHPLEYNTSFLLFFSSSLTPPHFPAHHTSTRGEKKMLSEKKIPYNQTNPPPHQPPSIFSLLSLAIHPPTLHTFL